ESRDRNGGRHEESPFRKHSLPPINRRIAHRQVKFRPIDARAAMVSGGLSRADVDCRLKGDSCVWPSTSVHLPSHVPVFGKATVCTPRWRLRRYGTDAAKPMQPQLPLKRASVKGALGKASGMKSFSAKRSEACESNRTQDAVILWAQCRLSCISVCRHVA